jgi:hypothetical protein
MHVDPPENGQNRRGVIDGSARIIGEVLRTPRIVKTARIVLGNLDPAAAPALVRAVMFTDSMLFLDAISAAPALVNAAVLGAREVCEQLLAMPADLLHRFGPRLVAEVSGEQLGETAGLALVAVGRAVEAPGDSLAEAVRTFEADFKRGLQKGLARDDAAVPRQVEWLAATIRRVARENPQLMALVRPLVAACREALVEGVSA